MTDMAERRPEPEAAANCSLPGVHWTQELSHGQSGCSTHPLMSNMRMMLRGKIVDRGAPSNVDASVRRPALRSLSP